MSNWFRDLFHMDDYMTTKECGCIDYRYRNECGIFVCPKHDIEQQIEMEANKRLRVIRAQKEREEFEAAVQKKMVELQSKGEATIVDGRCK